MSERKERDPARIDRMLSLLRHLWLMHPDWRLGQIVTNATMLVGDPFYVEDDTMEQWLRELLKDSQP